MRPRTKLEEFTSPSGEVVRLVRHDRDLYIEIDGLELMSTRRTGSEQELARLGCGDLSGAPRVLIGGLGFGFTARAALDLLPRDAKLVVAELFEDVVAWNRTHAAAVWGRSLGDPRLTIEVCDVWQAIAAGSWDAILLDTDNGPDFFCVRSNERLYRARGLERAHAALSDGGMLAIWSADIQPQFVRRLRRAGFDAHSETVRERGSKGQRYGVYLARKVGGSTPPRRSRRLSSRKRSR